MKVIALSDLHGNLPKVTTPFDLMLICGDICPTISHTIAFQEWWLHSLFSDWLNQLPYKHPWSEVIVIAGNHDFWFERYGTNEDRIEKLFPNFGQVRYLHHKAHTHIWYDENGEGRSIEIFGTPYCKIFGNWAFMKTNDVLEEYYSQIPEGLDILISHDAPHSYNGLGCITEGNPAYHDDVGNPLLTETLKRTKPKYYFCGHIHSGNHSFSYGLGTRSANVSICTEIYEPINKPLIFEYDECTTSDRPAE